MPAKTPTATQYATDHSKMIHNFYSSSCGIAPHKNRRSLTKIVGGYNSQSYEYPWQVSFKVKNLESMDVERQREMLCSLQLNTARSSDRKFFAQSPK